MAKREFYNNGQLKKFKSNNKFVEWYADGIIMHEGNEAEASSLALEASITRDNSFTLERWVAGAVAGLARVTVGYPFDQVKFKLQMQRTGLTLAECISTMWKDAGLSSFYKGSSLSFAFSTFQMSLNFGFKNLAEQKFIENSVFDNKYVRTYFAGMVGGFFHALTISPVDYIRIQQLALKCDSFKETVTKIPVANLFRGLQATIIRDSFGMGFYFTSFLYTNELFKQYNVNNYLASLLSGSVAGVCWWGSTYPFDISKTMLQKDTSNPRKYPNMMATFRQLYSESGIKSFYRGLNMCLLRAVIVNSVVFVTAECVHNYLVN